METINYNRGTYFYNIQKNDEYVIDEYCIWYKNYVDNLHLFEIYEEKLGEYILNQNPESKMEFCSYEELIHDNKNVLKTIMSYKTLEIEYKIEILNKNGNDLHVKIFLNNLLNTENPYYIEILNMTQEIKAIIIEVNQYYNDKKYKRSKEEKALCAIDKLIERF